MDKPEGEGSKPTEESGNRSQDEASKLLQRVADPKNATDDDRAVGGARRKKQKPPKSASHPKMGPWHKVQDQPPVKVRYQTDSSSSSADDSYASNLESSDFSRDNSRERHSSSKKKLHKRSDRRSPAMIPVKSNLDKFLRLTQSLRLYYSGDPKENLKLFLSQLHDHVASHSLNNGEVLASLHYILTGKALQWYLGHLDTFQTFREFRSAITDRFMPEHTQVDRRRAIQNEYMMKNELLGDYIGRMLAANQELVKPIKQGRLLDVILQNMTPVYKTRLATSVMTFATLSSLERAAAKADRDLQSEACSTACKGSTVAAIENKPTQPSQDKGSTRKCFYCFEASHMVRSCDKRKDDRTKGLFRRYVNGPSYLPQQPEKSTAEKTASHNLSEADMTAIAEKVAALMKKSENK